MQEGSRRLSSSPHEGMMKHEIVSEQQHGADERVSSSNNAENIMLKHGCINQSETEVSSTAAAGTTKWGPDSLSDTHAVKRTSTRRRDSAPPLATAAPPDRRGVHSGVSESLRWPTKLSSSSSRKEVSNNGGRRISLQQWLSVAVKARKEEWGILVPVDAALSPIADQRQNSRRSKSSSNNDSEKSNIRVTSNEHADDFKKRGTSSFFPEETLPVNMMGKDEDLARKDGGPGRNREEELFVGEHTYAESEEGAPALAAARVHRDYEADEEKSGIRSTTGERYPVQPPQHPTATEVDRGPSLLISSSSSSSSSSITSSSSARKNLKPPPPPLQQYRQAETVTSAEENKHVETNSSAVSKSQGDHHVKFLSAAEELTVAIGEDNQQGLTPNEDAETMYSHLPASPCSGAILPFSPRYATLQKFRKYMALRGIDAKLFHGGWKGRIFPPRKIRIFMTDQRADSIVWWRYRKDQHSRRTGSGEHKADLGAEDRRVIPLRSLANVGPATIKGSDGWDPLFLWRRGQARRNQKNAESSCTEEKEMIAAAIDEAVPVLALSYWIDGSPRWLGDIPAKLLVKPDRLDDFHLLVNGLRVSCLHFHNNAWPQDLQDMS